MHALDYQKTIHWVLLFQANATSFPSSFLLVPGIGKMFYIVCNPVAYNNAKYCVKMTKQMNEFALISLYFSLSLLSFSLSLYFLLFRPYNEIISVTIWNRLEWRTCFMFCPNLMPSLFLIEQNCKISINVETECSSSMFVCQVN